MLFLVLCSVPVLAYQAAVVEAQETPTVVFINEFHYDNTGLDAGEFVEIAYEAGADITGHSLVLYNGNDGGRYETRAFATEPANEVNTVDGWTFAVFDIVSGIQNGAPDGISLVDASNRVVEFLSYEGALTADDGPAAGLTSIDVGVSEPSSTPVGSSLQRTGSGCDGQDFSLQLFSWTGPMAETRAMPNTGQFFTCSPPSSSVTTSSPVPLPCTTIQDIQGTGSESPLDGQEVKICDVYITAFVYNGLFVQEDPDPAAEEEASSGIFVSNPGETAGFQVGDQVDVIGTVDEFFDLTEITNSPEVLLVPGGGTKLFRPVELQLPAADLAVFERYESMLVSFVPSPENDLVVSGFFDFDRFGEVSTCSADKSLGRIFQYTVENEPDQDGFAALQELRSRSCITIDDNSGAQNPDPLLFGGVGDPITTANFVRGGSRITKLKGPLFYSFGKFRVQPTTDEDLVFEDNNPRPDGPPALGGQVSIASTNVLNFFITLDERGADNIEELDRQTEKLLAALAQLNTDVFGIAELENNDTAAAFLRDELNSKLPSRSYQSASFLTSESSGSDAIRTDVFFDTQVFDYEGSATLDDSDPEAAALLAQSSIGSIFDDNNTNRVPIAVTIRHKATNEKMLIVACHMKSKGGNPGDSSRDVDQGDGAGAWNLMRTLGVRAVLSWVDNDPTGFGGIPVILGDMNAYAREDPIREFIANDYASVEDLAPPTYSFVFDGQWGSLDYIFVRTDFLDESVAGAGTWHVNADELDYLDYNFDFGRDKSVFDGSAPFRFSDHDPLVMSANLVSYTEAPADGPTYSPTNAPTYSPTNAATPALTDERRVRSSFSGVAVKIRMAYWCLVAPLFGIVMFVLMDVEA